MQDSINYVKIDPSQIDDEPESLTMEQVVQPQTEKLIQEQVDKIEPVIDRIRKSSISKYVKKKIPGLKEDEIEYGELPMMQVRKVKCESTHNKFEPLDGDLIMTNYKVIFKPYDFDQEPTSSPKKSA